ncbi:hypothetical protein IFM47457_05172 [Aspergillus lentulus]|nr:hypothetical protein IFM47457_05172 [Aspergillus lentulus]
MYDSIVVRFHEGQQRFTPMVPYCLNGRTVGTVPAFCFILLEDTTPEWFKVISPSIERVFRKLSWSGSPPTVTMLLPKLQDELVPRLLYPELDLREYDPLPLFNAFCPREITLHEWENEPAGTRYSPKEFCMVPDLIEGYRKKYGKNTLTVQWKGYQWPTNGIRQRIFSSAPDGTFCVGRRSGKRLARSQKCLLH